MSEGKLRAQLIAVLAVAAVLSVVGKKLDSPWIGWLSFAVFAGAIALYLRWRRVAREARRARVFDREAKTDEARTRPDQ